VGRPASDKQKHKKITLFLSTASTRRLMYVTEIENYKVGNFIVHLALFNGLGGHEPKPPDFFLFLGAPTGTGANFLKLTT